MVMIVEKLHFTLLLQKIQWPAQVDKSMECVTNSEHPHNAHMHTRKVQQCYETQCSMAIALVTQVKPWLQKYKTFFVNKSMSMLPMGCIQDDTIITIWSACHYHPAKCFTLVKNPAFTEIEHYITKPSWQKPNHVVVTYHAHGAFNTVERLHGGRHAS